MNLGYGNFSFSSRSSLVNRSFVPIFYFIIFIKNVGTCYISFLGLKFMKIYTILTM